MKNKKIVLLVLICFAILLLVGGSGYYFSKNKGNTNERENNETQTNETDSEKELTVEEILSKGYTEYNEETSALKKINVEELLGKAKSKDEINLFDSENYEYSIKLSNDSVELYQNNEDGKESKVETLKENVKYLYNGEIDFVNNYHNIYIVTSDNKLFEYHYVVGGNLESINEIVLDNFDGDLYYDISGASMSVNYNSGAKYYYYKNGNAYSLINGDFSVSIDENLAYFSSVNEVKVFTDGTIKAKNYIGDNKFKYVIASVAYKDYGYITNDNVLLFHDGENSEIDKIYVKGIDTILLNKNGKLSTEYLECKIYNSFDEIIEEEKDLLGNV